MTVLHELFKNLTPKLFDRIYGMKIPWPKEHEITPAEVESCLYDGNDEANEAFGSLCYEQGLVPLSQYALGSIPDLLQLLPDPSSSSFPTQALGLLLLLDQGPRASLRGLENLWLVNFFDLLAQRLCNSLLALPYAFRVDNFARWKELGYSYEHYALARNVLYCPLAHSDDYADQMLMLGLLEEFRRELEAHYATKDAARENDLDEANDVATFKRLAEAGPPRSKDMGRQVGIAECLFWESRMSRVHEPIVRVFRHNPYLNVAKGRENTEEEEMFFDRTDRWSVPSKEKSQAIIDAFISGQWPQLLSRACNTDQ